VLTTVNEETIAVDPSGLALELTLTLPVMTGLTVARLDPGEVESSPVEVTAIITSGIRASRVVDSVLATVSPVAVLINAEVVLADGEIARSSLADIIPQALRPVPRVETIELIALNALALRTASAVVEVVSLATSHGVGIAVLPAFIFIADKVASTSVVVSGIVDAGNPVVNSRRSQVRAREDIAVSSVVVVSGQRPELKERAPDTTDLRAEHARAGPVLTENRVVVGEVVIEAEIARLTLVTEVTSNTAAEKIVVVIDGSLATVSPEIVFIDAEITVAGTIVVLTNLTVELAEVLANSVTSDVEYNVAKTIGDFTTGTRLVVNQLIVGKASNDGVVLAISARRHVSVEIGARCAATSAVEDAIVERAATEVLGVGDGIQLVRDSGLVSNDVAPVPVSTAIVGVRIRHCDATLGVKDATEARIARAVEDVAEVPRALTILVLATIALRGDGRDGDEALGIIHKGRAVDGTIGGIIGVTSGEDTVLAERLVVLATVGRVEIAVSPARLAFDVALAGIGGTSLTNAIARARSSAVGPNVVLLSPGQATIVAATSIRLRIIDPRAIETVNENRVALVLNRGVLPELALLNVVVHGVLATVLPVVIVITAKVVVARGQRIAANAVRSGLLTAGIALRVLVVDGIERTSSTVRDSQMVIEDTRRAFRPRGRERDDVNNAVLVQALARNA